MRRILLDASRMVDIDEELTTLVEKGGYSHSPYLIMNKATFKVFKLLSADYDKKSHSWEYMRDNPTIPIEFKIAIDKKLNFGEMIVL